MSPKAQRVCLIALRQYARTLRQLLAEATDEDDIADLSNDLGFVVSLIAGLEKNP